MLVASAPDILFLKDTDGDDVADVRIRVRYGNGETEEQDIHLTEIDGAWKLAPDMDK